jgi:hypothetical protein
VVTATKRSDFLYLRVDERAGSGFRGETALAATLAALVVIANAVAALALDDLAAVAFPCTIAEACKAAWQMKPPTVSLRRAAAATICSRSASLSRIGTTDRTVLRSVAEEGDRVTRF